MDIVSRNPFRILGVFANDPIKTRTANIGKIRAYSKINKEIVFDTDAVGVFGTIDRSSNNVEAANAELSVKNEEAIISLFWLHRNSTFTTETVKKLSTRQLSKTIKEQKDTMEYSGLLNAAVLSLTYEDYEAAAQYYTIVIESRTLLDIFREEHDLSKKQITNKDLIRSFIVKLTESYEIDWWPLFLKSSHKKPVLSFIKAVFEKIALDKIRKEIEKAEGSLNIPDSDMLSHAQTLFKKSIPYIRTFEPLEEHGEKSAEAQLVLDKLSEELIRECKIYYLYAKCDNEQSVLPTMQMAKHALIYASNSETLDKVQAFIKELEEDAKQLPPKEVSKEASEIRKEIQSYCQKPDKIRWSLLLVKNCIPQLLAIKNTLGKTHEYYISISTKIADNAIYNSDSEIDFLERRRSISQESYDEYINALKLAWKLHLNLSELDLAPYFLNGKLKTNEEEIKKKLDKEHVIYDDITADISMETEDDSYRKCSDYNSLIEFCRQNPDSVHFKEAMRRIWKFEDDAYPQIITVKNLLRYKESYPNSHNDSKVLSELNKLLFSSTIGNQVTLYDYRTFLRLYPNHPQKDEALRRIDSIAYTHCKTIDDFKQYLQEYKDGQYRKMAERKIDYLLFKQCKTPTDFNLYIINNPNGNHIQEAQDKIEEHIYNVAKETNDYERYMKQYPNGKYSSEIRSKMEFEIYNKCISISDFQEYLRKFPNGMYSELAKNAIKKKQRKPAYIIGYFMLLVFLIGIVIFAFNNSGHHESPLASQEKSSTPPQETTSIRLSEQDAVTNSESAYSKDESSYGTNDNTIEEETYVEPIQKSEPSEEELYGNNRLKTGAKPYSSYFGKAQTGRNYLTFKTSGNSDYIVIVRRSSNSRYINHVYIRGGEKATLYLPDGDFYIYFYSGKGWNPNKVKGNMTGGFVSYESNQKDGPVQLYSTESSYAYGEYTLYPVQNGNLTLQYASPEEMFN